MKNRILVNIPARAELLAVVRTATERMAELSGLDGRSVSDIKLAVDEACANAIRHACGGDPDRNLSVEISYGPDGFKVVIDDDCARTDPAIVKGRDLEEVRPGGLGVHFIRKAFDEVSFDPDKKAGNRLILIKYLDTGRKGAGE